MARIRIELNHQEIKRLLRGEGEYAGVLADLKRRADAVAAQAGEGMVADVYVGPNRARGGVITATPEAMQRQARDRALTRAIDAARD